MAIASPSPATEAHDLVPLKEAAVFLSQSGRSVSVTTLRRWINRYGLRTTRRGGKTVVSMSALLRAQRDELDRLDAT